MLRVLQIANTIIMKPEGRDPYTVETLAIELRHLAYQTRSLKNGKLKIENVKSVTVGVDDAAAFVVGSRVPA